jgi:DNA-binding FadR family transcriptional regulator
VTLPLVRVDKQSAYQAVQDQLLSLIQQGEVAVGERFPSEKELSAALGVSRPVVREALGSLRAHGVIRTVVGRGTFVVSATPREPLPLLHGKYSAQDLYEVRSELEVQGASFAAMRRDDDDVRELEELLQSMGATTDPDAWTEIDTRFHLRLAEAARNRLHLELVEHLRASMSELSLAVAKIGERMSRANGEHRRILDAIVAGDEQRAARSMRHHIEAVAQEALTLQPEQDLTAPN